MTRGRLPLWVRPTFFPAPSFFQLSSVFVFACEPLYAPRCFPRHRLRLPRTDVLGIFANFSPSRFCRQIFCKMYVAFLVHLQRYRDWYFVFLLLPQSVCGATKEKLKHSLFFPSPLKFPLLRFLTVVFFLFLFFFFFYWRNMCLPTPFRGRSPFLMPQIPTATTRHSFVQTLFSFK